jgi:polar amino acid transport system substrate-binding protein
VAVIRDISARRRGEERARERLRQLLLTDKLTTLGVLAAGMAHEIDNPNQAILSEVTLLQRACPQLLALMDEASAGGFVLGGLEAAAFRAGLPRMLSTIADSSRRIDSLARNLLAFSREQPDSVDSPVDVNAVVASAIELVAATIKRATDCLSVALCDGLPTARGSSQRLEQVVINLVLNACQALSDRTKGVRVSTRCEDAHVVIEVADEGAGIPGERLSLLTTPFYTTRRPQGGTGLGLYVSRRIVEAHGGTLRFESRPDAGTTATVRLPRGEPRGAVRGALP